MPPAGGAGIEIPAAEEAADFDAREPRRARRGHVEACLEAVERPRDGARERVAVTEVERQQRLIGARAAARDEVAPAGVGLGDESGREKIVAPLRAHGPQISRREARDELRRVQERRGRLAEGPGGAARPVVEEHLREPVGGLARDHAAQRRVHEVVQGGSLGLEHHLPDVASGENEGRRLPERIAVRARRVEEEGAGYRVTELVRRELVVVEGESAPEVVADGSPGDEGVILVVEVPVLRVREDLEGEKLGRGEPEAPRGLRRGAVARGLRTRGRGLREQPESPRRGGVLGPGARARQRRGHERHRGEASGRLHHRGGPDHRVGFRVGSREWPGPAVCFVCTGGGKMPSQDSEGVG